MRLLTRKQSGAVTDAVMFTELRAALEAGASPGAALAAVGAGPLAGAARSVRLGRSLTEVAGEEVTDDARADLLLRALALSEVAGTGALTAVAQAEDAAEAQAEMQRLLSTHTVQARGTTWLLTGMPVVLWAALVLFNPDVRPFYQQPLGMFVGLLALGLITVGWWWGRRIVAVAQRASVKADPLTPARPRLNVVRAAVYGVPVAVVLIVLGEPLFACLLGGLGAVLGLRADVDAKRAHTLALRQPAVLGAAEVTELLAIAVSAGMTSAGALAAVAPLGPGSARTTLSDAARRLRAGWPVDDAFTESALQPVGATLAAAARWGGPAAPGLERLAAELRRERRAAVQAAAERTQLLLIFPTTLLMLPAFLLAVVVPMVWAAFAGGDFGGVF